MTDAQLQLACPVQPDVLLEHETLRLDDGYPVTVLHYRPALGQPTLSVLYVHGIQSHPGWFSGSCQALARAGCEVFAVTRRGSGLASQDRGDCHDYDQLLDDVDCAIQHVLGRCRADHLALVGVSWGGKLLTAYCLDGLTLVRSLTLVSPGIVPRVDVGLWTKLRIASALLTRKGRLFDVPLSDPALFTDNPVMQAYLRDDPHRLHEATARFLFHSRMLDKLIRQAGEKSLEVPTRLLLAGRDRIINNVATRDAIRRLTGGKVKVSELPAAHTMDFEPDPAPFYRCLCQAVME